jgi:hypothetical protein
MTEIVYCRQITLLPTFWPAQPVDLPHDPESVRLSTLYYALGPLEHSGFDDHRIEATLDDIQRWRAASARLAGDLTRIDRRSRLWPGGDPRMAARWEACRTFARAAGDLTERIQELHRLRAERREREERELRRMAITAALHGAPVWRYHRHFCQDPSLGRTASIMDVAIDALDPCPDWEVAGEYELTLDELNQAFARLREEDPYVDLGWSAQTARALTEWSGANAVRDAWLELTGVEITDPPPRPTPPRSTQPGYSPPITDYGITTF